MGLTPTVFPSSEYTEHPSNVCPTSHVTVASSPNFAVDGWDMRTSHVMEGAVQHAADTNTAENVHINIKYQNSQ